MLGVLHLDRTRLARHTDAKGARGRHDLDVTAFPTHHQHKLDRVSRVLAELCERNRDGKRIVGVPARVGGSGRLRLENPRHGDPCAL